MNVIYDKMYFDVAYCTKKTIQWIKDWFYSNGDGCNAVIGISGGKDSTVVAALCAEALGKDRVIGVQMPCGEQPDINYSDMVFDVLGIRKMTINIKGAVDGVINSLKLAGAEPSAQTLTNLPCRIRMSTLYAVSQSNNGRVSCNCNLSESYIGWETKWGDAVGDFAPLKAFTCSEVIEIGKYLGIPDVLINKVPSDGLQEKTDEDAFGFTYETLDMYLRTNECDSETLDKIEKMHERALCKNTMGRTDSWIFIKDRSFN